MSNLILLSRRPFGAAVGGGGGGEDPPPDGVDIFAHDFNDQTLGVFTPNVPFNTGPNFSITTPSDPTGSGRGYVAAFRYVGAGTPGDGWDDINRSIGPTSAQLASYGFGDEIYISFDIYFPVGTVNFTDGGVQRKILYCKNNTTTLYWIFSTFGNVPKMEWISNGSITSSLSFEFDSFPYSMGVWYKLGFYIRVESARGVNDGEFRLWRNNSVMFEKDPMHFTSSSGPTSIAWDQWAVGNQRETNGSETSIDEVRYIDNLRYTTGPLAGYHGT